MSVAEKVRLNFYITHPAAFDLVLTLTSPTTADVEVAFTEDGADFGTSTTDADRSTIDDDASTPIRYEPAPRAGTFQPAPVGALESFIGEDPDGTWTLTVTDYITDNAGTLHAASLFVTVAGVETRYDAVGLPVAIADAPAAGTSVAFEVGVPVAQVRLRDDPYLEVRITPLLIGIPGQDEHGRDTDPGSPTFGEIIGEGLVPVELADTVLIRQYHDVEVNDITINEGRAALVLLAMDLSNDPALTAQEAAVAALRPLQFALYIGYWRPDEVQPETVFWGQANVSHDYDSGTVTIDAADPSGKAAHHFIRRGDEALNVDKNRGALPLHADSVEEIIEAARNIPAQQDREVPGLGLRVNSIGTFDVPAADDLEPVDFERGQEVWDEVQQIFRVEWGPKVDMRPPFQWPFGYYASLDMYDTNDDYTALVSTGLGRNLDPADPADPAADEVVWDYGRGNDAIKGPKIEPGTPVTHQHVVDRDSNYRETAADAESSRLIGVWPGWFATDFSINPPHGANTDTLRAYADANVRAYGVPPEFTTFEMRPDVAQARHFGHPNWPAMVDGESAGGSWYIGDFVRLRATRGCCSHSLLVRITSVSLKQPGSNGMLTFYPTVVPAIGGTPGDNTDEGGGSTPAVSDAAPTVTVTAPADAATVSGSTVAITATAADDIGVTGVEFRVDGVSVSTDTTYPYAATWDSTGVSDGSHSIVAYATDTAGHVTVAGAVSVTTDNGISAPPPPPPPSGVLRVVDGELLDEDDAVLTGLTGGNMHAMFGSDPALMGGIATRGGSIIRAVVLWDLLEDTSGVLDAGYIASLDGFIADAETAGLHVLLDLHLNTGNIPSWVPDGHEPEQYRDHGQWITEALAYRYGNVASPQYTSTVIGFGLNEIPLSDGAIRNGMNAIPYLEALQRQMISWFRSEAAAWIGFVTLGYSNQTPYPGGGRTAASPTAYDSVGGNVIMDVHHYGAGCSNADPSDDGRQPNGHIWPTYQGGEAYWFVSDYPIAYTDSATHRSQMAAYLADYVTYCAAAGIPLMVGEFGWPYVNGSGKAAWEAAIRDVMRGNVTIALRWIISPSGSDTWASVPDDAWDPDVEDFLGRI